MFAFMLHSQYKIVVSRILIHMSINSDKICVDNNKLRWQWRHCLSDTPVRRVTSCQWHSCTWRVQCCTVYTKWLGLPGIEIKCKIKTSYTLNVDVRKEKYRIGSIFYSKSWGQLVIIVLSWCSYKAGNQVKV